MIETFASQKNPTQVPKEQALVLSLDEVGIADIPLVGGKNASLGEMIQQLRSKGVKVPNGFATTAYAYRYFIQTAGLEAKLREIFAALDVEDVHNLQQCGKQARLLMLQTPFPLEFQEAIATSYRTLCQQYGDNTDVAVRSSATAEDLRSYHLKQKGEVLVTGRSVGEMIGQGKVRVILDVHQINQFQPGDVLVTNRTDPDWEPIMKKASAIVTNQGGRTCHSAIIAREMGIPAIVGCGNATTILKTGQEITVSCAEGEAGKVYQDLLPYEVQEVPLEKLPYTRTKIMMNVGNPEEAFGLSAIPNDGVGLARMEFIIANHIKVHPLALIHFDKLEDQLAKYQIAELTAQYEDKAQFFVDKLAQGISTIAAAFYPKPVIVRLSDFKSNEYANLLGGKQFEPKEENPMIGWRGASRYYDQRYREGFALECQAMKQVRDEMGLTNVILMVPFCRTPEEGQRVLTEMAKHGLVQGENDLQVYVMCELPSNVQLADEFSQVFDGFSIGSNDLTQLTLGLDRDSELVAHLFDERNEAVKRMIAKAIGTVRQHGLKIGICGQAPSDYPEFARFLVEQGIDSISLNPDSVLKTRLEVAVAEQKQE